MHSNASTQTHTPSVHVLVRGVQTTLQLCTASPQQHWGSPENCHRTLIPLQPCMLITHQLGGLCSDQCAHRIAHTRWMNRGVCPQAGSYNSWLQGLIHCCHSKPCHSTQHPFVSPAPQAPCACVEHMTASGVCSIHQQTFSLMYAARGEGRGCLQQFLSRIWVLLFWLPCIFGGALQRAQHPNK